MNPPSLSETNGPANRSRRSWWRRRPGILLAVTALILFGAVKMYERSYTRMGIAAQVEDAGSRYHVQHSPFSPQMLFRKVIGAPTSHHRIRFAPGRVSDNWLFENRATLESFESVQLTLKSRTITDDGIAHLASVTGLTFLDASGSSVTDPGVLHLSGLLNLSTLDLQQTQVTDASIPAFNRISRLAGLSVANTAITENGIRKLTASLNQIGLDSAQFTAQAVDAPVFQRPIFNVRLYKATNESVQRLVDINVTHWLLIQGEDVTNQVLPALTDIIANSSLKNLTLLDVSLTKDEIDQLRHVNNRLNLTRMSSEEYERLSNRPQLVGN